MFYRDGIHDDTAELQALLDKRGIVTIDIPGDYLVSKTLIIHSNTRFVLSPGAHIIAAPMSRCALIENEFFCGGGRDKNIEIIGGIWDGNCDKMGLDSYYEAKHREDEPYSPKLFKGKLIRFAHADHLSLEKMTVKDPVSYGIQIADSVGFVTRDLYFDYNCHFGTTDGVHINGPAKNGVIENLYGTTNDDMVSLTTIDETHAEVTVGDITDISIRNVSATKGFSGIRLLSAGGYAIKRIHINGVYGEYRHNAVLISHHNTRPNTPIWFDDIMLEHIHSSKSPDLLGNDCFKMWDDKAPYTDPVIWIEDGIKMGNCIIRDVSRTERSKITQAYLIQIDKNAKIDRLVIENVTQKNLEGVTAPMWFNEGTINKLIESNIDR